MPDPLGGFAFVWPFYAAALAGYLLGSIPFGLLLTHLGGAGDIRSIGSGNIGATNVLRTGRKGLALATLLLDGGKGAVAVVLANVYLTQDFAVLAGGGALLGHVFPVWLGIGNVRAALTTTVSLGGLILAYILVAGDGGWSAGLLGIAILALASWFAWGGKGVATGLGILLAMAWPVGLAACAVWLIVAALSRLSSLAALAAFVLAPVATWYLSSPGHALSGIYQTDVQRIEFAAFLALVIVLRHRDNVLRLARGEEGRIGGAGRRGSDPSARPGQP